jgi:3'-phosphoadenosine 5'-phosphosulfate (PAPS) 3'-phosphatase
MTSSSRNMALADTRANKSTVTMTSPLSESDITFIEQLAREAGDIALRMRQGVGVHQKSGPSDLVTDADLSISKLLIAELKKRFPDDLVVSEEDKHPDSAEVEPPKQRRIWLIDPIDGTENYVKNDGQYTTMIGLLVDGAPAYGCIFQPSEQTLFYGGPAYGSFKKIGDNEPVAYEPSRRLLDKMPIRLLMGWSDRRKFPWVMSLPSIRFVPSESLGLKILKILEDQADLFVSLTGRVKLWDTAAPAAIAMGAQIETGTADGSPLPYPVPRVQHGSSVIIGRPGAISWAMKNLAQKANRSSG